MASSDDGCGERRYQHVLPCPCGSTLVGDSEDDLVENAFKHLRAVHSELADHYSREHVLFMAVRLPV
jgi:hypothetical protein